MMLEPSLAESTSTIPQLGARIAPRSPAIRPLCPGCFVEKGRFNPCPYCNYDEQAERSKVFLPHFTLLSNQYVVGRVLGKPGGFGITYLGWDVNLATRVAIKEYLPLEWAGRAPDRVSVEPYSPDKGEWFHYGLDRFLGEARTLACIDHPNVVRVRTYFTANATAYLVMDYYQGLTLAEHLQCHGGRLPEDEARQLILPILEGLRAVHAKGFLHRDIKPQNIYLAQTEGGEPRPILIDFGAARAALGGRTITLTAICSAGFSPIEQYDEEGKFGPWTDIYAVAAVLYCLVTGNKRLQDSIARLTGDKVKPAADFGVSKPLSDALATGLAITATDRPQTIEAFQAMLAHAVAREGPTTRHWLWLAGISPILLIFLGPAVPAYRNYLEACYTNGCGHQTGAKQRLDKLAAPTSKAPLDTYAITPVGTAPNPQSEDISVVDQPASAMSPSSEATPNSPTVELVADLRKLPPEEPNESQQFTLDAERNGRPYKLKVRGKP